MRAAVAAMLLAPLAAQAAGLREEPPSTCVLADNYMNAQYTVPVQLGTPPQTVRAVPDTGSFELITSAAGCDGCSPHAEYDSSKSSTFTARGEVVETHFGQGEVVSEAHYDKVRVGGLSVEKQSILLMRTNGLRGFADASYDAVMGLGMQTSARRNDTDLSLMSSLGTSVASVCYGQRDGEKGRLVLGGGIKGLHYTELPVIGDLHWALRLDGMKIGDVDAPGCADPPHCSAIVDSGTSLIALPSVMIDDILKKIDAHGGVKSDCSNIDDLPTIYLSIGGTTVELPPQLYVAKLKDVQEEETVGWGLFKFPFQTGKLIEACLPLFMEMELATAFDGPVFILGMPFLRAYSTKFDRETRKIGAPPPPRGPREPQTPAPHARSPRLPPRRAGIAKLPLGSSICTTCDDYTPPPNADAKSGKSPGNRISTLVPETLPAAAPLVARAPVKPAVLSLRKLMMPTWIATATTIPAPPGHPGAARNGTAAAPPRRLLVL